VPVGPLSWCCFLAPALLVAGFQLFTEGVQAAEHALRPLAMACGIAVVVTVLLRVTVFRRRSDKTAAPDQSAGQA
jgi:hypothetical protein